MTTVFLDTVGLIALWEQRDQWHLAARQAIAQLNTPGTRLVTSNLVLVECANAASRKSYRNDVARLRRTLAGDGRILVPTDDELDQAWHAYAAGNSGDASLVDHVSFILMRRLAITDTFTNDRHFRAAGFRTLF